MIPLLSLNALSSHKDVSTYSSIPQSFLIDFLAENEVLFKFTQPQEQISILSSECLNSEDSIMRQRINVIYELAAQTFIKSSNKYLKRFYLHFWKHKTQQYQQKVPIVAIQIDKPSKTISSSPRVISFPTFGNLKSENQLEKAKESVIANLAQSLETIKQNYYVKQLEGFAFQKIKNTIFERNSQNGNKEIQYHASTKIQRIFNQKTFLLYFCFMQKLKANLKSIKNVQKLCLSLKSMNDKLNKKLLQQAFASLSSIHTRQTRQGQFNIQKFKLQNIILTQSFSKNEDISNNYPLRQVNNSIPQVQNYEYNEQKLNQNYQPKIKRTSSQLSFPSSKSKLNKVPLRFSLSFKNQSSNDRLKVHRFCKPFCLTPASFQLTKNKLAKELQPLQQNFCLFTKTSSSYHIQPDKYYTQVPDSVDCPQIFYEQQSKIFMRKNQVQMQFCEPKSQSKNKQLQFKCRGGSPMHFKQINQPRLFSKSRGDSEDKHKLKVSKIVLIQKSPKNMEFKTPSSLKNPQMFLNRQTSFYKQINKARAQSNFVQEKISQKKDILFDSEAYFNS